MNLAKKVLFVGMLLGVSAWAEESIYVRNVCDTLLHSSFPKVTLKMAYMDETLWKGSKDLKTATSVTQTRHEDIWTLKPSRNTKYNFPYTVTASCSETYFNDYKYYSWLSSSSSGRWEQGSSDYATVILDIHGNKMNGYDSTNTNNLLVFVEDDFPEDGSYRSGEILASKTYEFQFDWWYASVAYYHVTRRDTVVKGGETKVTTAGKYYFGESVGMDSVTVVDQAKKAVAIPDSIKDVTLQVVHGIFMDERKIGLSSSSENEVSSSSQSAEPASSENEVSSSSLSAEPASSENEVSSSSQLAEPASSDDEYGLTSIANLKSVPKFSGSRLQVRRLDGSLVAPGDAMVPGVYYVKGANGIWKKQMVLPR